MLQIFAGSYTLSERGIYAYIHDFDEYKQMTLEKHKINKLFIFVAIYYNKVNR